MYGPVAEDENCSGSLLLITTTSLLLNSDDLSWLMPPVNTSANEVVAKCKCIGKQSISNLIQVVCFLFYFNVIVYIF